MTYTEFINETDSKLTGLYGPEERRAMAVRLLQHFCGISQYEHIIEPFGTIAPEKIPVLLHSANELAMARPLQYILGFAEFAGNVFHVEEGVLIPRSETEELVRWILSDLKKKSDISKKGCTILDAACGSGCIGISLASSMPGVKLHMCDISEKAVEITRLNYNKILKQNSEFTIFRYDLLGKEPVTDFITEDSIDVLVSNPPYVRYSEKELMHRNVLDYEPYIALFVPDNDPLKFYRAIALIGMKTLKASGMLFFEINEAFGKEVLDMLESLGYSDTELRRDLNGRERMVKASFSRCKESLQDGQPHVGR
ncbi:MAG: peptide chain release factor N(5)-glutamine methyltransferase [Rikenellaceae bacterium]|nr:peptide chain release factor N(5)-glutamine methyltransferase [Rikenellaceae bacterium]